ncbi:hypothetical protein E4U41_000851 [Claviceps citrina]|nr:hypothetical protein E4U41_000851 [Claviceps citrina]
MPRKRYRLFTFVALVMIVLLYRALQSSSDAQQLKVAALKQPQRPAEAPLSNMDESNTPATGGSSVALGDKAKAADGKQEPASSTGTDGRSKDRTISGTKPILRDETEKSLGQKEETMKETPRKKPTADEATPPHPVVTVERLRKPKEHFPLPEESIAALPTGIAKKLPKIQHVFSPEPKGAKDRRLQRQAVVRKEIQRSWAGYKRYAWMHDELMPVSNSSKDPFCGWAATLVDSLDTLWIAGLRDEFDEAATAARTIDFTHTDRSQIPVFETTIRYLGGLLAAYDVSGGASGRYSFLLDKAVELGETLMAIFDTPNRMPILYLWTQGTTSARRRAGSAGMAELATLSMEFTRLAQATGQHKYYDAVDRITNALVDLQRRGTLMPGLFPENLDISGCNRTATTKQRDRIEAVKAQTESAGNLEEPKGGSKVVAHSSTNLEHLHHRRSSSVSQKKDAQAALVADKGMEDELRLKTRSQFGANRHDPAWDCVPQGLVPDPHRHQAYHMGGSQDSAYEYFVKEYLLLGGKEEKYRKLHEDTVDGVNKHLLYRPMIPGDWDIIFPARVEFKSDQDTKPDIEYEVSHLTCFIGGMYALGGKLFGRKKDLDYAAKLADGCVWAYQSTASGIMPEHAHLAPCPTFEKCSFNETLWRQEINPRFGISYDEQDSPQLPAGYTKIGSPNYILRPEAIESVWYMYRITGDPSWMDKGWTMFEATMKATRTASANSAIANVLTNETQLVDSMESFWLAETLKYYYLLFSEPSLISLDEWVLNTEAHPFKL